MADRPDPLDQDLSAILAVRPVAPRQRPSRQRWRMIAIPLVIVVAATTYRLNREEPRPAPADRVASVPIAPPAIVPAPPEPVPPAQVAEALAYSAAPQPKPAATAPRPVRIAIVTRKQARRPAGKPASDKPPSENMVAYSAVPSDAAPPPEAIAPRMATPTEVSDDEPIEQRTAARRTRDETRDALRFLRLR